MSDTTLDVVVAPKSSRSKVCLLDDGTIKIYLNSPPAEGKANAECIELLSKQIGVAKSKINIVKGEKGKRKRIVIQDISYNEIITILRMHPKT